MIFGRHSFRHHDDHGEMNLFRQWEWNASNEEMFSADKLE